MKKKMTLIIVSFFLVLFYQGQEIDAISELKGIYAHLNSILEDEQEKSIHMKLKTEISYVEKGEIKDLSETQELYMNEENFILQSEKILVFKDKELTISIYNLPKTIHIIESIPEDFKKNSFQDMNEKLFHILENATVKEVIPTSEQKRKVKLTFADDFIDFAKCSHVEIEYDNQEQQILSLAYFYKDGESIQKNKTTFLTYELIDNPVAFGSSVIAQIKNSSTLKKEYQSFEVIDHRKNTSYE